MRSTAPPQHLAAVRLGGLLSVVVGVGVLLAYAGVPAVERALHAATTRSADDPAALPDLLAGACAAVGLLAWAWISVCCGWCALAHVRRAPAPMVGVPRLVQLVVATALGVTGPGMTGAGATTLSALSAYQAGPPAADRATPTSRVLSGLRLPDRTVGGPARPGRVHSWTVRPGDTLWAIAEHQLDDSASARLVDDQWRRIYGANPALGPDPDLIHPGTRLTLPPTHRGGAR